MHKPDCCIQLHARTTQVDPTSLPAHHDVKFLSWAAVSQAISHQATIFPFRRRYHFRGLYGLISSSEEVCASICSARTFRVEGHSGLNTIQEVGHQEEKRVISSLQKWRTTGRKQISALQPISRRPRRPSRRRDSQRRGSSAGAKLPRERAMEAHHQSKTAGPFKVSPWLLSPERRA